MKLGKSIAVGLIAAYVVFNVVDKMSCILWMNPMIKTLLEIKYPQEHGKRFTAQEVKRLIKGISYSYARWPYAAAVDGQGSNWTLRFEAAPLTRWRRAWCAVAHWEFNPHVPDSYEMFSDSMIVKCIRSDGSFFLLMDDEKGKTSKP